MAVNITTNGTVLDRHWAALVEAGDPLARPDSVSVSVDGLEATHDALRGRPGAWRKAWAAVDRLREAGIGTSVYFTATRRNVRELLAVAELAARHGAAFDFWPVNDAPDLALRDEADRRAWLDAVAALAARDPAVAARRRYLEAALAYHAGELGPVRCRGLADQYGVRYDGALLPCCVWEGEGLVVGNVFERPLRELWRSPEVRAARLRLEHEGCTVGCFNHSLHEYELATGHSFLVHAPGGD